MPDRSTRKEKDDYWKMRSAGVPPERAATYVGRSRSWGYMQEQEKRAVDTELQRRQSSPIVTDSDELPIEHISDAVECIICIVNGQDEKGFEYLDRHDIVMVPLMAQVARFLANVQALDAQRQHEELYEGYAWEQEVRDNPVTTEDVLRAVPVSIARYRAGEEIMGPLGPPRADEWFQRLVTEDPDFQAVAAAALEARQADDPEAAIKNLRVKVRNGDFISDDEPDPVTTNGHH